MTHGTRAGHGRAVACLVLVVAAAMTAHETTRAHPGDSTDRRVHGGGCLNRAGDTNRRQSTFGGSADARSSSGTWTHVDREGRTLLLEFTSTDARVTRLVPSERQGCREHPWRAEVEGTGLVTMDRSTPPVRANFRAWMIDHDFDACPAAGRDEYGITIREGTRLGEGGLLLETFGALDCGNIQVERRGRRGLP